MKSHWFLVAFLIPSIVIINTCTQPGAQVLRRIKVGDATIEVSIRGKGDPIILLPGTGGDFTQYDKFAPFLAEAGYKTIAISVRGASGSTGPLNELTLHDYASDVAGVIETLEIEAAHILGRAGGNRIARCLADDRPELVKSVIMVAAGGLVEGDPEAIEAMELWGVPFSEISEEEQLNNFRKSMLSPVTNPQKVKPWPLQVAAFEAQKAANIATPLDDWWEGGSAPLLVIQGLDDVIAPPGNGYALKEELGDRVRVVDIPDAGHALLFEQPQLIVKEIITFLESL